MACVARGLFIFATTLNNFPNGLIFDLNMTATLRYYASRTKTIGIYLDNKNDLTSLHKISTLNINIVMEQHHIKVCSSLVYHSQTKRHQTTLQRD